jgi:hypothetical protein
VRFGFETRARIYLVAFDENSANSINQRMIVGLTDFVQLRNHRAVELAQEFIRATLARCGLDSQK